METKFKLWECTAQIVAGYVAANAVSQAELLPLISTVARAVEQIGRPEAAPAEERAPVNWRKTVTPDYLVCLEDGKKFKSLKRHLRTHFDLTPEAYRTKWGLPPDYPMVAPGYAEARSRLAKRMRLGKHGR